MRDDTTHDAAGERREGEPDTPVVGGRYVRRLSELSHYGWAVYQYHQDPGGVIFPQVVASGLTISDADLLAHGHAALRAAADALERVLTDWPHPKKADVVAALARLALAAGRGPGE